MGQCSSASTSAALDDVDLGFHELEVCDQESNLHQRWNDCKKNNGHKEFIPATKFNVTHLPRAYRDKICFYYIMNLISLTVRLVVGYVSCERPDGYAMSKRRGRYYRSYGTGRVEGVCRRFTQVDGATCPCTQCEKLPNKDKKKQWGEFGVVTAKHVIFNKAESRQTQVDVDYNTDTDRDTCPKLHGVEVVYNDTETDLCYMSVVCHDRDVCLMLEERVRRYHDLRSKLEDKYKEGKKTSNPPIICVSHPHGMSKHVTVGQYRGREEQRPHKWRYTTPTCPGSSGATVYGLGKGMEHGGLMTQHSGRCKDNGFNESGRSGWWWW